MGKGHYPPIKPHKPVNPNPPDPTPHPQPAGVPLIWWTENEQGRLTDAEKANVGIATLIIQRDNGTLWRVTTDKAPYTWVQIGTSSGSDSKDPYKPFFPVRSADPKIPVQIPAWSRVVDDGFGRIYQLPDLEDGDSFEIVDVAHRFENAPVTVIKHDNDHFGFLLGVRDVDPAADSILLDVVGEGSLWRFSVVNNDIIAVIVPTLSMDEDK